MALDRSPELRLAMKVMASVEWEMLIKSYSYFSSGGHFVQRSKTILAVLVEGHSIHFYEMILKMGHWPMSRCSLKVFLQLWAAILFSGAERF